MADDPIPLDIRDFILRHIDSVAELEALLLLRANPEHPWDAAEAARRLYAPEQEIAEVLKRLCADGLLACEENIYSYSPSDELREQVDRLARVYARQLIVVTNMIHGKTRRIRQFADAFRFRKDR